MAQTRCLKGPATHNAAGCRCAKRHGCCAEHL